MDESREHSPISDADDVQDHSSAISDDDEDEDAQYAADAEAEEQITFGNSDIPRDPMDTDSSSEVLLENDSIAHMDHHLDSVFCIAQHPLDTSLVATGAGDDTAFVFSAAVPSPSYKSDPLKERESLRPIAKLAGHTDTVNCLTWSLPDGRYIITGGMEGRCQIFDSANDYKLVQCVREVTEVNYLVSSSHPSYPNTFALGGGDGSVWVYSIDADDPVTSLRQIQYYGMHRAPTTVGAWTPDGKLLASVDEEGELFMFDVFDEAAAQGIRGDNGSTPVLHMDNADMRTRVADGIYSLTIHKTQPWIAVGGGQGMVRVFQYPQLAPDPGTQSATQGKKGGGSKSKGGGGKSSKAGDNLHTMEVFKDSVESVTFSESGNLLAACSTDGNIAVFAADKNFQLRRLIEKAHSGWAVVKIEWCREKGKEHLLTSCGLEGVVKRWDVRGTTAAAQNQGMVNEWKGHMGNQEVEEGGGVLGFVVCAKDERIVSIGDDKIVLVFDSERPLLE